MNTIGDCNYHIIDVPLKEKMNRINALQCGREDLETPTNPDPHWSKNNDDKTIVNGGIGVHLKRINVGAQIW